VSVINVSDNGSSECERDRSAEACEDPEDNELVAGGCKTTSKGEDHEGQH
jgi:hypothetical protein